MNTFLKLTSDAVFLLHLLAASYCTSHYATLKVFAELTVPKAYQCYRIMQWSQQSSSKRT